MSDSYQKGNDGKEIALEARASEGERLFSPSVARNRDILRDTFLKVMSGKGNILEIGSGSGEHAVHIAKACPHLTWHGGDPDEKSRQSLEAWIAFTKLKNLAAPHNIDVTSKHWGPHDDIPYHGIVSVNMIHIAPFEAAQGLFNGAGRLLVPEGQLFLYGPFSRNGKHTSPSNADFNDSLRGRDERWGVRDLENDLIPLARNHGLHLQHVIDMPANNFVVTFKK